MFFTVKVVTKILVDALWGVSYPPLPLLPRYTHANPPSLSFLLSSLYCNLWLYFISLLSIIPRDWWAGTTHSVKNFLDFIPRYPSPTPPSWQITYFYSTKHLRNFHFLMALMNCLASNLPSAESQLLYAPPPSPSQKQYVANRQELELELTRVRLRGHESVRPESQIVEGKKRKEPKHIVDSNISQWITSLAFRMVNYGLPLYSGCRNLRR